jgi:hypothetical protein
MISIPKIVRELPMKEYAAELGEQKLFVWVNPTKVKLQAYNDLVDEVGKRLLAKQTRATDPITPTSESVSTETEETEGLKLDVQLREWYADLLSQGPKGTECSAGELLTLAETDPACSGWIMRRAWQLINEQRAGQKKA